MIFINTFVKLAALISTLLFANLVSAKVIKIDPWTTYQNYEDIDASVGDTIEFVYGGGHNVVEFFDESKYNSCRESASKELARQSPFTVSLTEEGVRFFACTFYDHCSEGQKIKVNVSPVTPTSSPVPTTSPAPTISPAPTSVPVPPKVIKIEPWNDSQNYEDIDALVGDTLEFVFRRGHNVVEFFDESRFNSCWERGSKELTRKGPFTVSLTEEGVRFFACTFYEHCYDGQKIKVNVNLATPTIIPDPVPVISLISVPVPNDVTSDVTMKSRVGLLKYVFICLVFSAVSLL